MLDGAQCIATPVQREQTEYWKDEIGEFFWEEMIVIITVLVTIE